MRSARSGCPTCILHYTAIQQVAPDFLNGSGQNIDADSPLQIALHSSSSYNSVSFEWEGSVDEYIHLRLFKFYDQRFQFEPKTQPAPGDTSSLESTQSARGWIETCNQEHKCMPNASAAYIPTRVLDIRDDCVRLLETTHTRIAATYACLSHCWGKGSELLCTTSSNRQAFQTHIFWNSLPRTFQDAISIARQLGLSFIWIDALCIIQDDSLDWQQQSAVMADIYHNAYITIAAAASANASGGCYTPKSGLRPYQFRKHLATIHFPDGIKRKVFPVRTNPHYSGDFPLLQRGWVSIPL